MNPRKQINRWRESYNPFRGLNLTRAVALAESYFRGEMADIQWLFSFLEQSDPDLFALLEMRLGRLLEMDWEIHSSAKADKDLADAQSRYLREKLDAIDNLDEAIEHLGMAVFRGYAHAEKIYADGDLVHLEVVDQWNAVRDGLRGAWKYNPAALTTSFSALPDAAIMPPERFLFREVRRPINRIALFKYVRSSLAEKDWDAFVEIFGFLGGVVIGPPDVPDGKADEFAESARRLAEGGSGFLPHGSVYTPNQVAKGLHPFKERLDHLSEKLILAGTGGKLTMLTAAGSGTLAGNAHTDTFNQIAAGEARRISEIFNRQLVAPWLDEGFPGRRQVAYFQITKRQKADVGKILDHAVSLSQSGWQADPKQISELTGYKLKVTASSDLSGAGTAST